MDTVGKLFLETAKKYPDKEVLLYKHEGKFHAIRFREFLQKVECFAAGLEALGFRRGDRLAIFSENLPQWMICDIATIGAGGIDVPLYTSLTPSHLEYIINDSGSKIIVVSNEQLLKKILSIRSKLKTIEKIIILESNSERTPEEALTFREVVETGRERLESGSESYEKRVSTVKPSDMATIMYTSGTTGVPKGVMLSHRNITAEIYALGKSIEVEKDDLLISFLPLSHVLERMVEYFVIFNGCGVGYSENIEALAKNLAKLKPTLLVSVPRVYEKIYSMISDGVERESEFKKKLFHWALKSGRAYRENRGTERNRISYIKNLIAEKIVLSKIKERLGGRLRMLISGGAPLYKEVGEFFSDLGLVIQEGYGLTETTCAVTLNRRDDVRYGTVGQPLLGIEIAIGDRNEILVRGAVIMQGYYKDGEGTRKVIDDEGWLHTGDVGFLDSDNFLTITDRLKDLIKTSGGKYVAPQQIENAFRKNRFISQAVVIGDRMKFITAILVPDFGVLERYAEDEKIEFSSKPELINNSKIISLYQSITDGINKELATFEKVRRFSLVADDFRIESEELTPTLKVKRGIILEKYRDVIEKMYD
ncbi:MAG: hypothetical protein A3C43_08030 [Candidatus Schekmanbacteria bacterium RIFCSPHIGHO2_02_FULL_38_11]|uniref:AMP-dependent synthetase/ligase domain-containing protein n=1 Tax=Candidatus Schekmanbacteria bacterium RIFCSPLOWO2_12_FULL_38_15 TaxID=1817883 RepID=A0A1F7SL45_9BACT|nr:MAG: hypothetical protein A2043_05840 [Candidatus Schekmanbacteria bacterium GWA2_38_9]OGL48015.1 MAG: hypothetical protein A3H37_08300 [Candidatus Schekmanbacteria bacterium RIFCSPLOWO2_02_FULL_38_14]OGL48330.1 MAG: hypothetical protein A3C43_08030 [Candidatus Schekmanbacteria bacterium RIFCSPHIGHO2_02_FULL_38_11]OGL54500.1 MAG: hypothetical protein A3G31_10090 [Candidatus Schekmanbacteria bacterium RIFCSPLOWO2_12_FULL_38_15]